MFKVISRTNLIQNVPIIRVNGEESVACIPPRGTVFTRRITPALQYLIDNNQISIIETNEHIQKDNSEVDTSTGNDAGSFGEKINITEFNSEEEQEAIKSLELESIAEISNVEESINENSEKPKRGRRKKTNGGES